MEVVNIVTAFMDLGRGEWEGDINGVSIPGYIKRTEDTYFERFERLAKIGNPLTVFTEEKYRDRILGIRNENINIGIIPGVSAWPLVSDIKKVQENKTFIDFVSNPGLPEYWNPGYILINFLKGFFILTMLSKMKPVSETSAWIDFGYCRDTYFPDGFTWKFDHQDCINLISNGPISPFNTPPLLDIIKNNLVFLQGCHIVGPNRLWHTFFDHIQGALQKLLSIGLVDDDQTLLLMALQENPSIFRILEGDSQDWFKIFTMDGREDDV